MCSTPVQAHRASVNGLDTYYEVQGSGKPLVMLHGVILVDLGPSVAALARDHTVITPVLRRITASMPAGHAARRVRRYSWCRPPRIGVAVTSVSSGRRCPVATS